MTNDSSVFLGRFSKSQIDFFKEVSVPGSPFRGFLRFHAYTIFNVAQIENLPAPYLPQPEPPRTDTVERIASAEAEPRKF